MALTFHPVTGQMTTTGVLEAEQEDERRRQAILALDRKYAAINAQNAVDAEKWRRHIARKKRTRR